MNGRSARELPPAQPGSFGGAMLNSYMLGFWIGLGWTLMSVLDKDLARGGDSWFLYAMGLHSLGWAKAWSVGLTIVASVPVSRAAEEYRRFTGRTFQQDRIGFARAGGQDIGMFSGLVAVMLFLLTFGAVLPPFVPTVVRILLLTAGSMAFGNLLARALARRAFSILLGGMAPA